MYLQFLAQQQRGSACEGVLAAMFFVQHCVLLLLLFLLLPGSIFYMVPHGRQGMSVGRRGWGASGSVCLSGAAIKQVCMSER
jgi:hypothetical protein